MTSSTECKKCGVKIQATTAESTGGFCMPCRRWFERTPPNGESALGNSAEGIERQVSVVQNRCLEKVGVTRDMDDTNEFKVLSGFLSGFVRLYPKRGIKRPLPELLIRCRHTVREELEAKTHAIRLSDKMRWEDKNGANWVDVLLDGSLDDDTLVKLIDDSYQLTCDELDDDEKECLSLLSRNLEPAALFDELLKAFSLARRREKIAATEKQAFLLRTTESADGELPIGVSRIGGLPDLPPDTPWPVFKDGKPLAFLAQIDLNELPADSPLPDSGMLSFFSVFGWQIEEDADPQLPKGKYKNEWTRVIYHNAERESLARTKPPGDVNLFDAAKVEFVPFACFPAETRELPLAKLKWKSDVKEKYESMISTYNMACMQQLGNPTRNLLLGYADFEQEFVRQVAKNDMRLLFQLGSDENAGMCWGDAGFLYFWIEPSDLENGNFDNILTDFQCG